MHDQLKPDSIILTRGVLIAGRYQIVAPIAKGGMGIVYKAQQVALDRIVALKVLQFSESDDTHWQRFKTEAKAAASLSHPNIVSVYDFGDLEDGRPFLVMEFMEGQTLARVLRKEGPLKERRAINIFIQVCQGLACAHEQNIIHRDLKPGNIILAHNGAGEIAKLIDFGLAKRIFEDQHLTQSGMILGTPFYMSPEQCRGIQTDARSDIYSLGCVFHETLTGSPPLQGDSPISTMFKHLQEMPDMEQPTIAGVNYAIKTIIWRCLQKDPGDRFQSAEEVQVALEAALTEAPNLTPPVQLVLSRLEGSCSGGQFQQADSAESGSSPYSVQSYSNASSNHAFPEISLSPAAPLPITSGQPANQSLSEAMNTPLATFVEQPQSCSDSQQRCHESSESPSLSRISSRQQAPSPSLSAESTALPDNAICDKSHPGSSHTVKRSPRLAIVIVGVAAGPLAAVALCVALAFSTLPGFRIQTLPLIKTVSPLLAFQVASSLGDLYFMQDNAKSLTMYLQAEALADKMAEVPTADVAHVYTRLGRLYLLQEPVNSKNSLVSSTKAKEIMSGFDETHSRDYGMCLADMAEAEMRMGKPEPALRDCQQALKIIAAEPQSPETQALLDDCQRLRKVIVAEIAEANSATAHTAADSKENSHSWMPRQRFRQHARGTFLGRWLHRL